MAPPPKRGNVSSSSHSKPAVAVAGSRHHPSSSAYFDNQQFQGYDDSYFVNEHLSPPAKYGGPVRSGKRSSLVPTSANCSPLLTLPFPSNDDTPGSSVSQGSEEADTIRSLQQRMKEMEALVLKLTKGE